MNETIPPTKKPKPDPETAAVNALAEAILSSNPGDEVELRLGVQHPSSGSFQASIEQSFFRQLRQALSRDPHHLTRLNDTNDVVHIPETLTSSDGAHPRFICDSESGALLNVNHKLNKSRSVLNPRLPWFPLDVRVSLSSERDSPPTAPFPPPNCLVRKRRRTTFESLGRWKVDLTQVIQNAEPMKYEVEIELDAKLVDQARENGKQAAEAEAAKVFSFLKWLGITALKMDSHWFGDVLCFQMQQQDVQKLVSTVKDMLPSNTFKRNNTFIGAMPVNFHRRHFEMIQKSPSNEVPSFYVSEKTDGVRHLLLVLKEGYSFLFDRSLTFFSLGKQANSALCSLYATEGNTLLDCELVRHQKTLLPVLMVFDVLMFNGKSLVSEPLSVRLSSIGRDIVGPYRTKIKPEEIPFVLIGKNFYPREFIGKLFTFVKPQTDASGDESGEEKHIFEDDRRCHFTDGIIFSPNLPYSPGANAMLLKWKYPTCWTVDFILRQGTLVCNGNGIEIDLKDSSLSKEDTQRILSTIVKTSTNNSADPVVELAYSITKGQWILIGIRTDKSTANHISVVMDTLEVLAENVSKYELIYRIMANNPEDDHWNELFTKKSEEIGEQIVAETSHSNPPFQRQQQQQTNQNQNHQKPKPKQTKQQCDLPEFPFPQQQKSDGLPEFPFPQ